MAKKKQLEPLPFMRPAAGEWVFTLRKKGTKTMYVYGTHPSYAAGCEWAKKWPEHETVSAALADHGPEALQAAHDSCKDAG